MENLKKRGALALLALGVASAAALVPGRGPAIDPVHDAARKSAIVVAIDAGHGGIDPGASSGGLVEKDIALRFARRLARQIDAVPGMRALMIRNGDTFLGLAERIQRARAGGANLLISLHADKTRRGEAEGAHVYTLSKAGTDDADEALAERENRADAIGGIDLRGEPDDLAKLLVSLAQRGTVNESEKLANDEIAAMRGSVTLLPTDPHRRANFRILKAPEIPSILVELGYMSNQADRARLVSEDWQARMASALTRGIRRWAQSASPGYLAPKAVAQGGQKP